MKEKDWWLDENGKSRGYIQAILAKENTIDLSSEEGKKWLELFRIAAQAPTSKCHDYSVNFSDGALRCLYCGEPCEINEQEVK